MVWREILLSPCPFWIGFCQLNFYQKYPNYFGGENCHQSGLFDTLPSWMGLIKIPLSGPKDEHFNLFHCSCQWGLKKQTWRFPSQTHAPKENELSMSSYPSKNEHNYFLISALRISNGSSYKKIKAYIINVIIDSRYPHYPLNIIIVSSFFWFNPL